MEEEHLIEELVVYDPEPEEIETGAKDASVPEQDRKKDKFGSIFSPERTLQLISIIEKHPVLWDKKCSDYRSVYFSEQAWRTVASQMELDVTVCKEKWSDLRRKHYDLTQRVKRSTLVAKGKEKEVHKPTWFAYEAMAYLNQADNCDDKAKISNQPSWQDAFAHSLSTKSDLELISLVKSQPVLWNKMHPESGNHKKINEAWQWVAKWMCLDAAVCKNKWNKLRGKYYLARRAVLHSQNGPGSSKSKKTKWFGYEAMSFLRDMLDIGLPKCGLVEHNFFEPNETTLKFIAVVKSHPALWNRKHDDYKSVEKLDATWQLVADTMDLDVEVCKTKWYHLRCQFRRIRRKMLHPAPDQTYQPVWFAYDALTFLINDIQHDTTKQKPPSSVKPKPKTLPPLQARETADGFFLDSLDILDEEDDGSDDEEKLSNLSCDSDSDHFLGESKGENQFMELMLSCENVEDSPTKEATDASTSGIPSNKKPRYDDE